VVADGLGVRVRRGSWPVPRIFRVLQERGGVAEREMFRTFNMGVGMAVVVDRRDVPRALRVLASLGQRAWMIGEVVRGRREVVIE